MSNIEHERWNTALNRVAEIERTSSELKSRLLPRKFTYSKRSAWATPAGLEVLPIDQQHELPGHGEIRARVRADSVLIGKFDVEEEVRLRSFYPEKSLSVRYQTGGKRNGITRAVDAHSKVHPHAPELMPTIYDHGTIRKGAGAYLVEDTVNGEVATRSELEALIIPLTQRLHKVHQGVGIQHKHLSKIVGGSYRVRWSRFVESQNIDADVDKAVQRLIARNDRLEVSMTHGDLVNSNILVNNKDFVLVDWEFAEMKPIAFDMSKMIINVNDLEQVLKNMHVGLGGKIGTKPGHYTFREQIALSVVLTLSWHKNHLAKARVAGRTEALTRQTAKRLDALKRLLDID